jgi:hypothetical protein
LIAARFVILSAHFVKCDMSEQCTIETMRALPWCSFAILVACDYSPTPAGEAPVDTPSGVECGWTFAPHHIGDPCALTINPGMTMTAGTWVYDTATGSLADPGGIETTPPSTLREGDPAVRVLAMATLELQQGATLRVVGTAGLALVVDDTATIDGVIDVSATLIGNEMTPGPGGNADSCDTRVGGNGESKIGTQLGGGGGGGGGFGTAGAGGGNGGSAGSGMPAATGGPGGTASDTAFVMRGGCGGGAGGVSNSVAGIPGAGGGALLLIAKGATAVRTSAELRSAGAGALNGLNNSGGAGGGSGGLIAVESPSLAISGALCANGGGGAGGSSDASLGDPGESGTCALTAAGGGNAAVNSNGDGGAGGFGTTLPTVGEANLGDEDGGGGGGGSVGQIYVRTASLANTGTITPPLIALPF